MGMKEILGVDEVTAQKGNFIWRAALAEFIANFLLNFFGVGIGVFNLFVDLTAVSLHVFLLVFVLVNTIIHISGNINPAVSVALFAVQHMGLLKMLIFIVSQCLGSITGTALLMLVAPQNYTGNYGVTNIAADFTVWKGLVVEIMLGFMAMFVIMGYIDKDRTDSKPVGILAIGAAFGIGHFLALHVTGAGLNPARSLGSAVVGNVWENHWVYWLGPITGFVLGALTYRWTIQAKYIQKPEGGGKAED